MSSSRLATYGLLAAAVVSGWGGAANAAEKPVSGGILNFVVGSNPPSYDAHFEQTFGVVHPIGPFYSLLLRANPDNLQDPTDFVCDLCEGKWEVAKDGLSYTFKIRENVKFHDGTPLTAADLKATIDKIAFPPEGVPSARQSWYTQIASVEAPEPYKLVVKMKRPLPAIIPALASPFNFVYSKKDLDTHGYKWHQRHINGTGAFLFVQEQPGAFVEGKKNPNYFLKGQPYLDGFRAVQAPKMSVRLQAIRGDRAAVEFRGFPPKARDDLVAALGDKVKVQESNWNTMFGASPNQKKPEFADVRVRQALAYALDRYGTAEAISRIAITKYVGGLVFPGHPLEAKKEWLSQLPGYGKDIKASREKAKQLLKEAGHSKLKLSLWNRAVDQPYKIIGTWFVDQWRRVGIDADQKVVPTGPWYAGMRQTRDFDVTIDPNAQTIVNPTIDTSKYMGSAGNNYSNTKDKKSDELYLAMLYETDPQKQYEKMRTFEKYILLDSAQYLPAFWWYRITVQRTYFKGWNSGPSHYVNQGLENVWIDPKLL
ncbi:MAG: ABC transporter substrate-binding protein [Alphaproteobacteria bacterium]|nr:ABC transporter substrate-binding protein [Alphaproteobacteria bacterium]